MRKKGKLTHRLSARIVNEDEKWVAAFDETVPPADARSGHLPRQRHKAVTCLDDFKFLSIERAYVICKLGRWKTSHVRVRPGEGWRIVARAPYTGCHLMEN